MTDGPPEAAPAASKRNLLGQTVAFCRLLRSQGVGVTPAEVVDAARALEAIDLSDRREVYLTLRAVTTGRVEDHPVFAKVFASFWNANEGDLPDPHRRIPAPSPAMGPSLPAPPQPRRTAPISLERWMRPDSADGEPLGVPMLGDQEALAGKDFATFASDDLAEISRLAARLARRLAARPSRRWAPAPRGDRVHPLRTLRRALRTGGDPVELAFRTRKPRKTRLVVLCDVSGSMDLYARFLLQFLYALQNCFSRVETFVFSTGISRVTEPLQGESYSDALARLSREVHDWSGGTRIGASLGTFNRRWPRLVDRRTVVLVLSDGWDTGPPEELAAELRALHRRTGRLIWLNPLLGNPGYQPLTRGMQAALPEIDVFAPAHNLASLEALARHLVL